MTHSKANHASIDGNTGAIFNRSNHSKASDILIGLWNQVDHEDVQDQLIDVGAINDAAHQLYTDLLELIGETVWPKRGDVDPDIYNEVLDRAEGQEALRKELRTALANYFGQREV